MGALTDALYARIGLETNLLNGWGGRQRAIRWVDFLRLGRLPVEAVAAGWAFAARPGGFFLFAREALLQGFHEIDDRR